MLCSSTIILLSLALSSTASVLYEAEFNHALLTREFVPGSLHKRQSNYCSYVGATCESCFGSGFVKCPDGINCYKPGDATYGSCTGGTSSSGSSSDSSSSDTDSSITLPPTTDYCSTRGASCVTCFGSGYIQCPGSDTSCYNPDIETSCCPGECRGGSISGGSRSSAAASEASSAPQSFTTDPATFGAGAATFSSRTTTYSSYSSSDKSSSSTLDANDYSATAAAAAAATVTTTSTTTSTRTTATRSATAAGATSSVATFAGPASGGSQGALNSGLGAFLAAALFGLMQLL